MASSSSGPSRSRTVGRTLSNSSLADAMPSGSGSRSTSNRQVVNEDEDDDVIIIDAVKPSQTSANIAQTRPAKSARKERAAGKGSTRVKQQEPLAPASTSQLAPSTVQSSLTHKRKPVAMPGDGFKMDFRHSQQVLATIRSTTPPFAPPSSPLQTPRPTGRPSQLPQRPFASARTTSNQPEPKVRSSFDPPLAQPTQTQSKSAKPLRAIPRPPTFAVETGPPPSSSTTPKAPRAARDARRKRLSAPPSASQQLPPSALPPRSASPTSRPQLTPPPRPTVSHRVAGIMTSTDWSAFHPSIQGSHLFKLEYALHGGLTFDQVRSQDKSVQKEFATSMAPRTAFASAVDPSPSWISDARAVAELKVRLGEREHFVALMWARDVLGRDKTMEGSASTTGELRKNIIGGVDMWLLGKEFPLRFVSIVGIIVGIVTKDDFIAYEVDDGTAVIFCKCPIALPRPEYLPAPRELYPNGMPKTPSPRKRKAAVLDETVASDCLEVGMLAKVLGTVEEHWVASANRGIAVEKIEHIRDVNFEAQHHLQVARLHREVYSQPFNLEERLGKIKHDEVEQWSHLPPSQASTSVANTPKKIRFRRPAKLAVEDITPQNFVTYIRQHLRDNSIKAITPKKLRSPTPSPDNAPWQIQCAEPQAVERPQPFALDDLENDRHLRLFATRLAQKHEMEKRLKRKGKAVKHGEVWVKQQGRYGEPVETQGLGSRGGSSLLLPTISSGVRSSKRAKTEGKVDESPLSGDQLELAISKRFRQALIDMVKKGVIVVNTMKLGAVEEDDEEDRPSRQQSGPTSSPPVEQRKEFLIHQVGAPWPLRVAADDSEEEEKSTINRPLDLSDPSPRPAPAPKAERPSRDTGGAPWALVFDDDEDEDEPQPAPQPPPRPKGGCPWDLVIVSDDEDDKVPSKHTITPRKRSALSHPASSPSTVKPNRTQKLALDQHQQSTSQRSSPNKMKASSPDLSSPGQSAFDASVDRTFLTDSSWSDSIAAVDEETYELVTYTSLAVPVYEVLRNVYSERRTAKEREDRAMTEQDVRRGLVTRERWQHVARYSELVGKALQALEGSGEVKRLGVDKFLPLKGLGFGKLAKG